MKDIRIAIATLVLLYEVATAVRPTRDIEVYRKESEGYRTFRIPSLLPTRKDRWIVAFAEGRVRMDGPQVPCGGWMNNSCCFGESASDADGLCYDKDVVFKLSKDGGASWGASVRLTTSNETFFYSNPTGVLDRRTGVIFMRYSRCAVATGYNSCDDQFVRSLNNGESFEDAYDLSRYGNKGHMSGVATGIQTSEGRLILQNAHSLLSDDDGRTWWISPSDDHGWNEQQIAELQDGTLLSATRGGYFVQFSMSHDEAVSWTDAWHTDGTGKGIFGGNITTNDCALSLISVLNGSVLLLSHPNRLDLPASPGSRRNLTVTRSDELHGLTGKWQSSVQVYAGPSAYSSLGEMWDGECGVLYERSAEAKAIVFDSINLATFPCDV